MYLNGGNYLGVYSNINDITLSTGDEDFGLDAYEHNSSKNWWVMEAKYFYKAPVYKPVT